MTRRPFLLCITGSMGAGKTTTAGLFAQEGLPVWNADAAVARAYSPGGRGAEAVRQICPAAVAGNGRGVDKTKLKKCLERDPGMLKVLEKAVHPLVEEDREAFLDTAERDGADIAVLEIPLLYETGADRIADAVVAVSAPDSVLKSRVRARGSMTGAQFDALRKRQLPDAEKRARARYVVESASLEEAGRAVRSIIAEIRNERKSGASDRA